MFPKYLPASNTCLLYSSKPFPLMMLNGRKSKTHISAAPWRILLFEWTKLFRCNLRQCFEWRGDARLVWGWNFFCFRTSDCVFFHHTGAVGWIPRQNWTAIIADNVILTHRIDHNLMIVRPVLTFSTWRNNKRQTRILSLHKYFHFRFVQQFLWCWDRHWSYARRIKILQMIHNELKRKKTKNE